MLTVSVKAQSNCNWVDGQDASSGFDPDRGITDWNAHYNFAQSVTDTHILPGKVGNRLNALTTCLYLETYAKMYADVGIKIGYYGESYAVWSGDPDQTPGGAAWLGHYKHIKNFGNADAPQKVTDRLNSLANKIPSDAFAKLYADISVIVASYGVYGSYNNAPPPAPSIVEAPTETPAVAYDDARATEPPPPLPVYEQPQCPVDGYLWTPGYWAYDRFDGYYWVPGVWVNPPQYGYLWTPAYWGYENGYYGWHRGYWGPTIGFYGGVNYGYGYCGSGFVGGRWEGGGFRYNTAVVNVNTTIVHNTYIDRTVIVNNTTVNRVSYNGPGGIQASPNARELAAVNQQHITATTEQTSHQQLASQDKSQFASTNHGVPATTAMNKIGGSAFTPQGHPAPPPVPRQAAASNKMQPQNTNQARPFTNTGSNAQPKSDNNTQPQNTNQARPFTNNGSNAQPKSDNNTQPQNTNQARPFTNTGSNAQPKFGNNTQPQNNNQAHPNSNNGSNRSVSPQPNQQKAVKPQQKRPATPQKNTQVPVTNH